jgi:hypothetical protein
MHSPVTAIRRGRPRPQFVAPQQRHLERNLGLSRRSYVTAAVTSRRDLAIHPRAAVRLAARSLVRPTAKLGNGLLGLHSSATVNWTRRNSDGLRAAREGSAAAWRA